MKLGHLRIILHKCYTNRPLASYHHHPRLYVTSFLRFCRAFLHVYAHGCSTVLSSHGIDTALWSGRLHALKLLCTHREFCLDDDTLARIGTPRARLRCLYV